MILGHRIRAIVTVSPILIVLLGGCSHLRLPKTEQAAVKIEQEGAKGPLTPAQQDENYQRAFAEGLKLVENREFGLAIGAFEAASEFRPDSPEALFNLGACHESIGDPLRAINFYRRVLEISPDDPDCYRNLGTSFIKLYYREKSPAWRKMAADAWSRSLQLRPDQPDVREYLAQSERPA